MSTARRIYHNILFLTSAEFVSKALQLLIMVLAARVLDKAAFGKFSFALSLSFIAIIIADMGINQLLIREIARKKKQASSLVSNALPLKLGFSLLTFAAIVVFLNLLSYPEETKIIVYVIWIFSIFTTFTDLLYSIFRAFEQMRYDAYVKIVRMLILTSSSLYVLFTYESVILFSFTFVGTELVTLFVALLVAQKNFVKVSFSFDIGTMKWIVKQAWPFGLAFSFSSIYFFIDTVMLSVMRGDVEVAIYNVAYNLAFALILIPTIYGNALYPVMSRFFKSSKRDLISAYLKSIKYMSIAGIPVSIGLYMLSNRIIVFFYERTYIEAGAVLQIVAWMLMFKFINFFHGFTLAAVDQQKKRMMTQGFTALFNVIANLILIPLMGFMGAAIATLITEIFLFVLYFWHVSRHVIMAPLLSLASKPLIAGGVMALAIYIIDVKIQLLFLIPLSALVYVGMLLLLRTFSKEDVALFKKVTAARS